MEYTINPPYRRLSFRQKETADNSLVRLYASSNHLDLQTASSILSKFIKELREQLIAKKTVVFPGLGRLRATRENTFFFIADESLNIYPEGFGLEPVSLKTHVETEEEVEDAVAAIVKEAVAATGATSKKDMGKVMKEVMARVKGQADGKLVSRLVGAALP